MSKGAPNAKAAGVIVKHGVDRPFDGRLASGLRRVEGGLSP